MECKANVGGNRLTRKMQSPRIQNTKCANLANTCTNVRRIRDVPGDRRVSSFVGFQLRRGAGHHHHHENLLVVPRAGSDLSSLFDGTPSSKKEKTSETTTGKGGDLKPEDVELKSESGLSYELLRDLLAAGEWEKADDETRLKLIQLAGEEAVIRGWVYFTEVKEIPVVDLQTIDKLWQAYSNGRYGYSVQKKLWVKSKKVWTRLFKEIDWVQGENNAYKKWPLEFDWKVDAKKGHLPLTNCLRGTQLFQAVLEHPAFEEKKKKVSTSIEKNSIKI